MKDMFRKIQSTRIFLLPAVMLLLVMGLVLSRPVTAAADPTDEIEQFQITVDVREDATLQMTYHIDWKVLDDEKYGPLTWVEIGVPNLHHSEVTPLSVV